MSEHAPDPPQRALPEALSSALPTVERLESELAEASDEEEE